MALRAFTIWCGLLVMAILNGGFRQRWLTPRLGERRGHWVSTLMLCAGISVVSWLTSSWIHPQNQLDALLLGLGWALLTIAFEFLAGHFVFGKAWPELFADYNVFQGRTWASGSNYSDSIALDSNQVGLGCCDCFGLSGI